MKINADNPITNKLGTGIGEDDIVSAIDESGYPLQIYVANLLRESFTVEEEWAYLDRDTNNLRSLDLRAVKPLYDLNKLREQPRIRPTLNLLIECKQSDLPYVFFESQEEKILLHHPIVYGLRSSFIVISTDDSRSSWRHHIVHALDLHENPFQLDPKISKIFSKCVRKKSRLELSGTDAYHNLILPLVKAIDHLGSAEKPPETALYFDAHLSIALGVLDAPMLLVRNERGETVLELSPWIRVIRNEYSESEDGPGHSRDWVVDIVHKGYLDQFLKLKLEPFAADFAERVFRHQLEIATGSAFAPGMEDNCWRDIEPRMRPKK